LWFVRGVKSPCNLTCRIEPDSGYCAGCGRDIAEIVEWPSAPDDRKQQILLALPQRLAAMTDASPAPVGPLSIAAART
jgi:predicted Fe-S protein YdhL (DUF1289 family)